MKKTIIILSAFFTISSVSLIAQDGDKKQEPKKEEKKSGAPSGGTRMAINEKGLPGTGHKKETSNNNGTQKSTGTTTVSASDKKNEQPK